MKRLTLLAVAAAFIFGGCNTCDMSTRETKMKKYKGDPNATSPYITQHAPKLGRWAKERNCTSVGCSYTFTERVMIHNPLDKKINVDTNCKWVYNHGQHGEYEAAKNYRKKTTVDPKASRGVEMSHMVTLPDGAHEHTEAKCSIVWTYVE